MSKNLAASVRGRLLSLSRARKEEFNLTLTNYALERLLYRLGRSPHHARFVLEGALLFRVWADLPHRPTRDLDLLGYGDPSPAAVGLAFREICAAAVEEDGVVYDSSSVETEVMKEGQEYEGVRVACRASLGSARIEVRIDVGFGDAVEPGVVEVDYPSALGFPAPRLLAYPMQAVVAEKFQAMIALGIANGRMKDFFDLWVLAHRHPFDGPSLCRAIAATFARRGTTVPAEAPLPLTEEFWADPGKSRQWRAFLSKGCLNVGDAGLDQVCEFLREFLLPPARAVREGVNFQFVWEPAGPWRALAPPSGALPETGPHLAPPGGAAYLD